MTRFKRMHAMLLYYISGYLTIEMLICGSTQKAMACNES